MPPPWSGTWRRPGRTDGPIPAARHPMHSKEQGNTNRLMPLLLEARRYSGPMMSEFLRFYIEQCVTRKREKGEPIEPSAIANEVAGKLPNYRHLKKRISAIAVEMAAAMNAAEIAAQFIRRPKR